MEKRAEDDFASRKDTTANGTVEEATVENDIEIPDGGLKAWTSLAGQ